MESVSRISTILETTRDLTLEAARDASFLRRPPQRHLRTAQLQKLLDSRHEREVLEGLRSVIAISQRPPIPSGPPLLFSSVLKNIASPSLAVKKLVYVYLLQHAEAEPDTALLSINTIQKTLSSPDPHLRALALRVMSGIRVPVISQIVSLAIKKGCADMSPIVRKSAALAIPKCWRLDPAGTSAQLEEYLSGLLGDRQYYVAGAAVLAFMQVCPDRIDLIHKHYHSLVRKLVDMDEWGQLATLRLMLNYARKCFPLRTRRVKKGTPDAQRAATTKDFYGEEDNEDASDPTQDTPDGIYEDVPFLDPDLTLLLTSAQPLLQSRNSAVIIAVTRLYLYLAPPPPHSNYLTLTVGPLISLLRSPPEIALPALHNITRIALVHPRPLQRHAAHFLLRTARDTPAIRSLKLELLTLIFPGAPPHLQSLILSEAAYFCTAAPPAASGAAASDPAAAQLLRDAVRAIGRCAQAQPSDPAVAHRCMRLLLGNLRDDASSGSGGGALAAESLTVIRHLIQADPGAHAGTVTRLAKSLDATAHAGARASIIWLVGEFAGAAGGDNVAADVLRILAKTFKDEEVAAKLQILLLAAKIYVHYLNSVQQMPPTEQTTQKQTAPTLDFNDSINESGGFEDYSKPDADHSSASPSIDDHPIPKLYNYILLLTRYDTSYDLRDRARVYRALLSNPASTQLATLLLLAPKPVPSVPSPSESRKDFMLGSASLVIGAEEAGVTGLAGYEPVPGWVEQGQEPDPKLRETDEASTPAFGERKAGLTASERLDANVVDATAAGKGANGGFGALPAPEKSLDDWLAEDEASGEGESEETESEENEEGSEEEEESEEDESEDSEDDDDEAQNLVK